MVSEKLKPCPFCGATPHHGLGKVRRCQLHGEPLQTGRVWCPTCRVERSGANLEIAKAEWNKRSLTAALEPAPAPAAEPVAYRWTFDGERWGYGAKHPGDFRFDAPITIEPLYTHPTPSETRLREALEALLPNRLCGEDWNLPDTETVAITVTFGAIKTARAALKEASDERA